MNTARAMDTVVRLSCARCSTSHRVRDIYALTPGMKAFCAKCGAPFVVVAMPDASLGGAPPLPKTASKS
ncbi:MAG TPA: hypothetical protein VJ760_06895 [Nitrospiraceae bacterium]|nr:hypothetical protein [Nitrospiraceae bacterium]